MKTKRDVLMAFIIYLISGELVGLLTTITMPWTVLLFLQPVIVAASIVITGLTFAAKNRDR